MKFEILCGGKRGLILRVGKSWCRPLNLRFDSSLTVMEMSLKFLVDQKVNPDPESRTVTPPRVRLHSPRPSD